MKKVIISVLILGLVVAGIYAMRLPPNQTIPAQELTGSPSFVEPAKQENTSLKITAKQTAKEVEPGEFDELTTRRWHDSHGYPTANNGYNGYDTETLFALAEQGDVLAMQSVATVLILTKDYTSGYDMFMDAAARGSTFSLTLLGNEFRDGRIPVGEEDSVLAALPYYVVAGLRGDVRQANEQIALTTGQGGLLSRLTGGSRPQRDLEQEEIDYVCARGLEIYDQIQTRRTNLGLRDFENTPMPGTEDKVLSLCRQ